MGGFNMSGSTMNPQQTAANGVKATPGSSPSLGQMQQGMGGLITNDTQQNAFNGFMGGLTDQFSPMFNSMINSGYQGLGMEAPTQNHLAPEPELSPYELRIRELMANRGMSRDEAVANQAGAMQAGGDINNNGAITNQEWAVKLGSDFDNDGKVSNQEFAQWKQQNPNHVAAGGTQQRGLPNQTPQQDVALPKQESLFELPERTQKAIARAKKIGGLLL